MTVKLLSVPLNSGNLFFMLYDVPKVVVLESISLVEMFGSLIILCLLASLCFCMLPLGCTYLCMKFFPIERTPLLCRSPG